MRQRSATQTSKPASPLDLPRRLQLSAPGVTDVSAGTERLSRCYAVDDPDISPVRSSSACWPGGWSNAIRCVQIYRRGPRTASVRTDPPELRFHARDVIAITATGALSSTPERRGSADRPQTTRPARRNARHVRPEFGRQPAAQGDRTTGRDTMPEPSPRGWPAAASKAASAGATDAGLQGRDQPDLQPTACTLQPCTCQASTHERLSYYHNGIRPCRLTDVGHVIQELARLSVALIQSSCDGATHFEIRNSGSPKTSGTAMRLASRRSPLDEPSMHGEAERKRHDGEEERDAEWSIQSLVPAGEDERRQALRQNDQKTRRPSPRPAFQIRRSTLAGDGEHARLICGGIDKIASRLCTDCERQARTAKQTPGRTVTRRGEPVFGCQWPSSLGGVVAAECNTVASR